MSGSTSNVWMNITTSAEWKRPPVGIVRVERELCVELEKIYGKRFKKCVWQGDRFVEWVQETEVDCHEISRKSDRQLDNNKENILPIYPIIPRRQALAALGQSILSLMPGKLRPIFNKFLYAVRPRVSRFISNPRVKRFFVKNKVYLGGSFKSENSDRIDLNNIDSLGDIFVENDKIISIGLDWDYPYCKSFYYLRKHKNIKIITCCYDLIPVIYPQYCVSDVAGIFLSYFLDMADSSDVVLCISKKSEQDLLRVLNEAGGEIPRTHVFSLGDNVPVGYNASLSPAVQEVCKQPFILFVSTIERRKNHEVIYRAYHLLCAEGKADKLPKMIFVGMEGWGVGDLLKDIKLDPLTRDLIVQMNHVTDCELRALYDSAKFCVFPSLYEGWGLPVGEALALGKPVLSSDRGSLPEVGGALVTYVDPWDPRAWADEIYRMSTDEDWYFECVRKITSTYKPRTWSDAALSIKRVVDSI